MAGFKKVIEPDFSDGVDRKELKSIRARFEKVNAVRLKRALFNLSLRHQDILEVLPLLFDVNHPLLPGFVSRSAPKGVSGYQPSKSTLSIAKSFSQTFKYRRDSKRDGHIHALFMMGSSGTLAQADSSDIDLWLCYDEKLGEEEIALLESKAKAVDEWANDQGLELHTFLMQAEEFRGGSQKQALGGEHSGSAQHYLLLDEFYRTAVHLAGRYPLWWLIPPSYEKNYAAQTAMLLSKRFVKASEVIDFGTAADIPKGELLGAGLWQLYKSLDTPYKSVLKLLLAEVYAKELPEREPLSMRFKRAVYNDELDPDELDPYYLIYQRLEQYLQEQNEWRRLELVRKAFYLKVGKKLTSRPHGARPSWQREFMRELVDNWGWHENNLKFLDSRYHWKVDQVLQERQELVGELTSSYRFLSSYARMHGIVSSIKAEDLSLLGRKLYATFQRKAGKVENINPGIAPNLWEENLAIHHSSSQPYIAEQNSWLLYRDLATASDATFQPALKKTTSLIELVAWAYYNGMLNTQTRLSVMAGTTKTNIYEVRNIVATLEHAVPLPLAPVEQSTYRIPAAATRMIIFVNVGIDPLESLTEQGMTKISDWNDSLGFSAQKSNLVSTIDVVSLNSWNEMTAHRFEMGETLIQNLQNYLQLCFDQPEGVKCRLEVKCFCPQRADAIARRVKELFEDAYTAFMSRMDGSQVRYLVEIEQRFHLIDRVDNKARIVTLDSEVELQDYIAQSQPSYCRTIVDRHALKSDVGLRVAFRHTKPGQAQAMYMKLADKYRIFVVDESGALVSYYHPLVSEGLLRHSLLDFYHVISERRQLRQYLDEVGSSPKLLLYKLVHAQGGRWVARKMMAAELDEEPALEVHAIGEINGDALSFNLVYDHREFSFVEYGARQVSALADYIKRKQGLSDMQAVIVSDIQLPDTTHQTPGGFRTLQYYRYKHQIEQQLLEALSLPL